MKKLPLLALLCLLTVSPLIAAELTIELDQRRTQLGTEELLKHPNLQTIEIVDDVSYKRTMHYRAIPVADLLDGLAPGDHLQVRATDGFAAELPAAPLLSKTGSKAWLAIEDPANPWPRISQRTPSAGPFYLVWENPAASQIGPEQWPFQVASIKQLAAVSERFPNLLPDQAADSSVSAGFEQFQKNCLACHKLNGEGDAQFGPDLNLPYNPTEYFSGDFLRQYIRNPQSLRQWSQGKMPGFAENVLSEQALSDLISYLKHMAGRKVSTATN
ncbi:c-type cytochrome [Ectopseudomonas mendocina]|uniref:C-type cytochrome n=1 Tax=Ectopseudomonas mendocina TaxID=300 RepID=A0ABZ2RAJ6_ECTME